MTTAETILTAWDFDPSVVVGCAGLAAVYVWKCRHASALQRTCYLLGVATLFLAIESPLDALGDTYLFSAHMAQHLLLILIVPPLLLWGIPQETARKWLQRPLIARWEKILGRPAIAWFACIGTMTVWHLPVLYNYALAHETVHILQHLSFLVTGTMFWWPVLGPLPEHRMAPMPAIFYLFAAVAENTALGVLITFMPVGYYPAYLNPPDPLHILHAIRTGWGMTPRVDQGLGGLLMWIPGCSIYFIAILGIVVRWSDAIDAPDFAMEASR